VSEPPLSDLQAIWEAQAKADPLWAILSEDSRRRRGWDLPAFLKTGEDFVEHVMVRFEQLGHKPGGAALDFGCGVGRLTQPLARRFESVIGVDISPTMIEGANRLNQFGERVSYVLNDEPNLSFIPSASLDLVMSFITLQHIPPAASRAYLQDFLRVLRPGGLLFFQLPSHRNTTLVEVQRGIPTVSPDDCRSLIEINGAPTDLEAGSSVAITVTVRNESSATWVSSADHPLRAGNHWIRKGRTAVQDDGRSPLPATLPPGTETETTLTVTAPTEPGLYDLQVDVVQEGVRWFGDVGSSVPSVPLNVKSVPAVPPSQHRTSNERDPLADLLTPEWSEPPTFAMHAIARGEVEALLETYRAHVLETEEHLDDWVSYGYFVALAT